MLSVLQYAVDILKVKHIVVCGHYNCGGCASAMSNRQYGLIDNWLRNIKDIYSANETQMNTLPNNAERLDVYHTTIVQNAWARGQSISLHGWVYRLSDGILELSVFTIKPN
ncbi:carbonic anhydrase [Rhizoclosmatium globosum]|uniref:Carbonic anhydrase n=1 Tax=Rhizoclosmatium globosum TaxID=329046 RepID=A0A1Y2CBM5_9FUNG|nr:carbonic anhydrase [Rhizoclosmatium globosum]|eukprot:ORY44297.1 carbonic anhydrase [Rhizoclosmatium globosum]